MKKKVSDFVKSLGGTTQYSGKSKTMYIHHTRFNFNDDVHTKIIEKFGYNLPFKLS